LADPKVLLVVALILPVSLFALHLNGWSLDLTDRELYVVMTDSMDGEPRDYEISTIPVRSLVAVDRSPDSVEVGDVIGYVSGIAGFPVFHRVVSIDHAKGTFTVKGDNVPFAEEIPAGWVMGKVVGVDPLLGNMVVLIRENLILSIAAAVAIPALFLIRRDRQEDGPWRYSK